MQAFLISLSTVAIAEIGDRTQLLVLMLAARFGKPWSILAGVLCATLVNHVLAGLIGVRVARFLTPAVLDGIVGASLIGMAVWALKADAPPSGPARVEGKSAFITTAVAFFLAELGDKTQIATLTLAAAYANLPAVVAGTTCGMLLADAPVVFIGKAAAQRLPLKTIHFLSSALFFILGVIFVVRALHEVR
jgi:Ca2+/H+ antiporter, TMEM165/GDT1 family